METLRNSNRSDVLYEKMSIECSLSLGDMKEEMMLSMVTLVDVKAGDQLCISYTELLAPTLVRRNCLLNNKLFLCHCER